MSNFLHVKNTRHASEREAERNINNVEIVEAVDESWRLVKMTTTTELDLQNMKESGFLIPQLSGNKSIKSWVIEYLDLIVILSADMSRVITCYRNTSNAAFLHVVPSITKQQWVDWFRVLKVVWTFNSEEEMNTPIYDKFLVLFNELLIQYSDDVNNLTTLFLAIPKMAPKRTLPVVDLYTLIAGRNCERSLALLYTHLGLADRQYLTANSGRKIFATINNTTFEKNLLTNAIIASSEGDLERLQKELKDGADANQCDMNGWNCLFWSTFRSQHQNNYYQAVLLLLQYGARIKEVIERKAWTILHIVTMSGDSLCLQIIIEWQLFCDQLYPLLLRYSHQPTTAMILTLERLLEIGLEVCSKEGYGTSQIILDILLQGMITICKDKQKTAVADDEIEIVQAMITQLLQLGKGNAMNINPMDWNNNTPLMYCQNAASLQILLARGGDCNNQEKVYGNTLLHTCCYSQNTQDVQDRHEMIALLLAYDDKDDKMNCDIKDKQGKIAIQIALDQENYSIARLLVGYYLIKHHSNSNRLQRGKLVYNKLSRHYSIQTNKASSSPSKVYGFYHFLHRFPVFTYSQITQLAQQQSELWCLPLSSSSSSSSSSNSHNNYKRQEEAIVFPSHVCDSIKCGILSNERNTTTNTNEWYVEWMEEEREKDSGKRRLLVLNGDGIIPSYWSTTTKMKKEVYIFLDEQHTKVEFLVAINHNQQEEDVKLLDSMNTMKL